MRDFEFSTAFTQFFISYFLQEMKNKRSRPIAILKGEGSGPEYSVLLHSFKTTGAAQGGEALKFRSGVELMNMVMIHSEGNRNFYSVLNI